MKNKPALTIRHGSFGPIVWDMEHDCAMRACTQDDMDLLPVGSGISAEEEDTIEWCACECGCTALATTDADGSPSCEDCTSYSYDDEGTFLGCGRGDLGRVCPDCTSQILWGRIETGRHPGSGMYRLGQCQCEGVEWRDTEHGSDWHVSRHSAE